jgi:hypothetical protein
MGRLPRVGGRRRGAVRGDGRRPSSKASRRHAAGAGLPSCGSLARARQGPGRISEGRAGTVYPKGENSLAPEATNRKATVVRNVSAPTNHHSFRGRTAPRRSGPPIARAGDGGGAPTRVRDCGLLRRSMARTTGGRKIAQPGAYGRAPPSPSGGGSDGHSPALATGVLSEHPLAVRGGARCAGSRRHPTPRLRRDPPPRGGG